MHLASIFRKALPALLSGWLVLGIALPGAGQESVPADPVTEETAPEPELWEATPEPTSEPMAPPDLAARLRAGAGAAIDRGLRLLPPGSRQGLRDLRTFTFSAEARRVLVYGLTGVLLLLLVLKLARGRGDVVVTIEYPTDLRGTFTVRIRRRPWGEGRRARVTTPAEAERLKHRAAVASRTVHPMVSRETRFTGLVARRYRVEVDGFLQSSGLEAVVTSRREEREIRVRRGRTERIDFDFHPRECPVEVKVTWDGRPATEALVGLRGRPGSVRYARGSTGVRLGIPLGTQTLLVGSGDRVAEHTLEIASFQPTGVSIDLADREVLLFTGCPPAVEPYLQGDVSGAARALERDGQDERAHWIRAQAARERGNLDEAAHHYEQAGHFAESAGLYESLRDYARAAELYDKAGDAVRAAEMYRSAGDLVRAGEAYESARQFESAVECFREASEVGRWIDSLERYGSPFQAAQVAIEHEDWGRAIRCLEQVTAHDPHYQSAAELLVDAYQRQGHLDLAARKIEELVARRGEDHAPLELCDKLSRLLEEAGEYDRALDVLELIRRRDATWPELAARIEELRKRRSRARQTESAVTIPPPEFGNEFRYELMEEIGRGGMGVVYKARDRRLGRVVALKQLPDNLRNHPKAVELFLREARAAAALNHPNIVTLFDAGHEAETYYITMELLQGFPLQKVLKARRRFGFRDAAKLCIQVAHGLQYAHEQGVIHRDIKTGNLFFTKGKVVKIMDFGLAKMVEEVRRAATVIGGTPYYMAPEQGQGGPVDHRVDVYALGATLYEFLTGGVPFDDGDVAYHHRHTPPPDPREKVPDLPEPLAELLLAMLAKKPEERVGSAREVAERLQEIAKALAKKGTGLNF